MSSSRNRSETFIKQGSESSSNDEEEATPKYDEGKVKYEYARKLSRLQFAIRLAASLTVVLNAFYFTYLLKGCGVRLFDFAVAFLTFASGALAVFFLCITTYLRSHLSLRPFIIYHAFSLSIVILLGLFYFLYILDVECILKLITKKQRISTIFANLPTYNTTKRLLLGICLAGSIGVHSVCLHISLTYHASLTCFLTLHTRNTTFV